MAVCTAGGGTGAGVVVGVNYELEQAWNNLPDYIKAHPGVKRLYRAAGVQVGPEPDKGAAWAGWREHPQFPKASAQTHFDAGWVRAMEATRGVAIPLTGQEKNDA